MMTGTTFYLLIDTQPNTLPGTHSRQTYKVCSLRTKERHKERNMKQKALQKQYQKPNSHEEREEPGLIQNTGTQSLVFLNVNGRMMISRETPKNRSEEKESENVHPKGTRRKNQKLSFKKIHVAQCFKAAIFTIARHESSLNGHRQRIDRQRRDACMHNGMLVIKQWNNAICSNRMSLEILTLGVSRTKK